MSVTAAQPQTPGDAGDRPVSPRTDLPPVARAVLEEIARNA